ncbi:transposase, partial [Streptococcus pneumoniae]|uniref:transposase n=2 Tax=Streptococcus pneumoniae TaxID=1313 RepID=UPI0018857F77
VQIMNQFHRKSHEYKAIKRYWKLIQQDSCKLSDKRFYRPIFQTVFKTFLKDKEKIVNALQLPYSNAKLEATNNLIKLIKRNAFGFRNFENFKKRIFIALNIKKERTKFVLSRA